MREIHLIVIDNSWDSLGTEFLYLEAHNSGWRAVAGEELKGPWLGFIHYFSKGDVLYREMDILSKGVILKFWGFEEDFKNQTFRSALFHEGRWYLKEDSDNFDYDFSCNGEIVKWFALCLSDKSRKINILIRRN